MPHHGRRGKGPTGWSAPRDSERFWLEFSAMIFLAGEERETMKASRFSDAQKAFIIKQGEEGTPVAEICRQARISQATYFNWKKPACRAR